MGGLVRFRGGSGLPWGYLGGGVPFSWTSRDNQTLIQSGFDLLGPVLRAISRAAEREEPAAWAHARLEDLPAGERHLALTPWVDQILRLLARLLDLEPHEEEAGALPRWPGRARFAVALSHDVDMLFKWRLRSALRLLLESPRWLLEGRRRQLAGRWRELLDRLRGGADPWFLVDELMDLEERHGLHATLLFLARPRDHQTFRYHLDRAQVRGLLARIRRRGFETALHGGWGSHRSASRLAAERHRLERLSGGGTAVVRQHWLRFLVDGTWSAQQGAGLAVDSSLGFNDRPAFRAGTSLPFRPVDMAGRARPLLELPLILMDSQLFDEQGLTAPAAARQSSEVLELVRRGRGLLTVNWHPHTLCQADFPGRRELLEGLLQRIAAPDCWTAGLGEVAAHWREREGALGLALDRVDDPPGGGGPCAS
jgi:hypothetical protein